MNKYLEKIALSRAVKEYAKGTITSGVKDLVSKGVLRSDATYAKGMQRGNEVLAGKVGAHIQRARVGAQKELSTNGGGYMTLPSEKGDVIMHNKHNFGVKGSTHQGMIRHEVFESMEADAKRKAGTHTLHMDKKKQMELIDKSTPDKRLANKLNRMVGHMDDLKPTAFLRGSDLVGMHLSPRVLARESEMVRKNPHLHDTFKAMRSTYGTNESKLMKRITGKEYGKDKMTGKDFHKANVAKPDSHMDAYGVKIPAFDANK